MRTAPATPRRKATTKTTDGPLRELLSRAAGLAKARAVKNWLAAMARAAGRPDTSPPRPAPPTGGAP
jgi:hypothetical protein